MTHEEDLISVGFFKNGTDRPIVLYLEMLCAEVHLSPGDEVEVLAVPDQGLLPVTFEQIEGGFVIYPREVIDPRWHVRFNGKLIPAGWPTILDDHR